VRRGDNEALIVVDVLNAYEHEDAEKLVASMEDRLPATVRLCDRAREHDVLRVYVNDNFDDWTLDRTRLVERALGGRRPDLVQPLVPDDDVPLVLKGRHSIFWETPLSYMLHQEEIGRIVLCGQVTEQCILYSALDAYIRHFDLTVVPEACAHIHEPLADAALQMMERNMRARLASVDDAFGAG
jgi:nicotinamidase-related amidase